MHEIVGKLVVYRNIKNDEILKNLVDVFKDFCSGEYNKNNLISRINNEVNNLLQLSTKYGFNKNLWHNYLTYLLIYDENPFALVSEKRGANKGSINDLIKNDLTLCKELFEYDFSEIEQELEINCFSIISNYTAVVKNEQVYNKEVSDKVQSLSQQIKKIKNEQDFYELMTNFYKEYGVGKVGLNKAFRLLKGHDILTPITSIDNKSLDDLIGYERQKEELIRNTEAFLSGKEANNVLLYGDAGTGKSSSIKALLNKYYLNGLRIIEIYKHELIHLTSIIDQIKNRNYYFIIFMDDLSFEEFEIEYKYLKAVIEGGLEVKPNNILIYATSNRRHLIRETWSDRSDANDEVHRSDTIQEKLSLAARFGLTISYYLPSYQEYHSMVKSLARMHSKIKLSDEELELEASRWEMKHGDTSGRSAQQFINYLLSK